MQWLEESNDVKCSWRTAPSEQKEINASHMDRAKMKEVHGPENVIRQKMLQKQPQGLLKGSKAL